MIYKYIPLISFCSVNIYQGEVPQYGVSLPCGPIHMGKFFDFLTHTSGHRLVKSAPWGQYTGSGMATEVCCVD